jgi:hypothetical protein
MGGFGGKGDGMKAEYPLPCRISLPARAGGPGFAPEFVMTFCLSYAEIRLLIIKSAFIIKEGFYYYKDFLSY